MPVWAPSLWGSIRMVAVTRVRPPAAGWTLTSPNGSTTFLSWAMTVSPGYVAADEYLETIREPSQPLVFPVFPVGRSPFSDSFLAAGEHTGGGLHARPESYRPEVPRDFRCSSPQGGTILVVRGVARPRCVHRGLNADLLLNAL